MRHAYETDAHDIHGYKIHTYEKPWQTLILLSPFLSSAHNRISRSSHNFLLKAMLMQQMQQQALQQQQFQQDMRQF